MNRIIAVVGPTCTGKTALAVALAKRLRPAELLNADSRQLRRGLRAGTCAPTPDELEGVPCRLLDLADPGAPFSVADWLAAAELELHRLGPVVTPIVVGGTGLYVSALIDGFNFGGAAPDVERRADRLRLAETPEGRAGLAAELRARDPSSCVDPRNARRVVRALEILDARGGTLDQAQRRTPRPATLIGLEAARETHATWIGERTRRMFADGTLLEEVRSALARGVNRTALAASGIGYAEALDVVRDRLSLEDAITAATRRTLQYARAQRTYFRRDRRIRWLRADELPGGALVEAALAVVEAEAPVPPL